MKISVICKDDDTYECKYIVSDESLLYYKKKDGKYDTIDIQNKDNESSFLIEYME